MAMAIGIGLALVASAASARPEQSTLTRESYRRNCLLCHKYAAPEGVSQEILAGLHPVPGLRPRDALPRDLHCWRRCEKCQVGPQSGHP
jgi:hypothetical protein